MTEGEMLLAHAELGSRIVGLIEQALTGYTRLTEERGDEAGADLAEKLATLVRRSSQERGTAGQMAR
jgi:hypothetical protein